MQLLVVNYTSVKLGEKKTTRCISLFIFFTSNPILNLFQTCLLLTALVITFVLSSSFFNQLWLPPVWFLVFSCKFWIHFYIPFKNAIWIMFLHAFWVPTFLFCTHRGNLYSFPWATLPAYSQHFTSPASDIIFVTETIMLSHVFSFSFQKNYLEIQW